MGEKPKYEVGQRWNWRDVGRWRDITLVRRVDRDQWEGQPSDGSETGYFGLDMLAESTFLGWAPGYGPSPPAPTKTGAPVMGVFPRPTPSTEGGPQIPVGGSLTGKPETYGLNAAAACPSLVWRLTPDQVHPYNLAAKYGMELHDHGRPVSALQRIQARKPPEPYVPSVDDWDLLPDAGT